jgi:hypothetical protein
MNESIEARLLINRLTTGIDPIAEAEASEIISAFLSLARSLEPGFAEEVLTMFSNRNVTGKEFAKLLGAFIFLVSNTINTNGIYTLLANNGQSNTLTESQFALNILHSLNILLCWDYDLISSLFASDHLVNVDLRQLIKQLEDNYLSIVEIVQKRGLKEGIYIIKAILTGVAVVEYANDCMIIKICAET